MQLVSVVEFLKRKIRTLISVSRKDFLALQQNQSGQTGEVGVAVIVTVVKELRLENVRVKLVVV